MKEAQLLLSN